MTLFFFLKQTTFFNWSVTNIQESAQTWAYIEYLYLCRYVSEYICINVSLNIYKGNISMNSHSDRSKQHSFPNPEKSYIIYKIIIFLELIRELKSQDNQVNWILNKDKPHPKDIKTYKLIHLRQSMGHTSNKWVKRNQLNLTNS